MIERLDDFTADEFGVVLQLEGHEERIVIRRGMTASEVAIELQTAGARLAQNSLDRIVARLQAVPKKLIY